MVAVSENMKIIGLVVVMLVLGSWNTLCAKYQFQTCAPTIDVHPQKDCPAGEKLFNKPWMQNIMMFAGEASIIIVYGITRKSSDSLRRASLSRPTVESARDGLVSGELRKTPFYIFAIPAFCDVFGTGLACVGMQYIDSALFQMMRSSIIIFTAVVSVVFLKRRLEPFHWVATLIVFCGLMCVGGASILDAQHATSGGSPGERILGMSLLVFAQLCASFQYVFEEKLLTGRERLSAKKLVGMEGCWGLLYMVVILTAMTLAPGPDNGHYSDLPDSIHMLGSPTLLVLAVTFMFSIAWYNLTGITVGKKMTAVVRCLVDSCRTIIVWAVNLILYYFFDSKEYGQPWTPHSWLTVIGFLILVIGTLLYNQVLPSPACLRRPREQDGAAKGMSVSTASGGTSISTDANNSQVD